jgi:hypothetical protein
MNIALVDIDWAKNYEEVLGNPINFFENRVKINKSK